MISYAMCLESGSGVAKDEEAAFKWYVILFIIMHAEGFRRGMTHMASRW
jgi:TPR repeat protein